MRALVFAAVVLLAACQQGPKGDRGPEGLAGREGATGPRGATGERGPAGVGNLAVRDMDGGLVGFVVGDGIYVLDAGCIAIADVSRLPPRWVGHLGTYVGYAQLDCSGPVYAADVSPRPTVTRLPFWCAEDRMGQLYAPVQPVEGESIFPLSYRAADGGCLPLSGTSRLVSVRFTPIAPEPPPVPLRFGVE